MRLDVRLVELNPMALTLICYNGEDRKYMKYSFSCSAFINILYHIIFITGLFVLEHHTLPGYTSRVVVDSSVISFDLDLVWGQNTFDGPHQLWRASSDYSLKV